MSRKSNRIGNSSPKRAWTASPSSSRGWRKTRSSAGTSTRVGAEAEEQAVLLRHAVEAPGVVRRLPRQAADLLHPLPAPGAGVEEGHHPEGPPRRGGQPAAEVVALDQLRRPGLVRVEEVVDPVEERSLQAVGRPPVHEEAPLVELARPLLLVVGPQARDLVPPLPLLDLPAREVGVDEDVRLREESGPRPHHEHQAGGRLVDAAALDRRAGRVDEVGDRQAVHAPEDGVVAEEGGAQALDLGRVLVRLPRVDHEGGAEAVREHPAHLVHVDAGVALDGQHAARSGSAGPGGARGSAPSPTSQADAGPTGTNGLLVVAARGAPTHAPCSSGTAPSSAARSPSAAARTATWPHGVHACRWTCASIAGRTAAALLITPPPTTSTSGSQAWTIATAPAAQTPQAAVAHRDRDRVAFGRAGEERLEVEPLAPREGARREAGGRPAERRQGPGRGLGLDAADPAAGAGPALEVRDEVPAEDAGLEVLPAQEPPPDHRDAPDAGAERHHHHVVRALRRPGVALAEEREARVVLDAEGQAERLAAPGRQVQAGARRRTSRWWRAPGRRPSPRGRRSRRRGRRSSETGDAGAGRRSLQRLGDRRQGAGQAASGLERHRLHGHDLPVGHHRARGVAAAEVHRQRLHHDRSISSRLRPFVSGMTRQMKRKLRTLIAA